MPNLARTLNRRGFLSTGLVSGIVAAKSTFAQSLEALGPPPEDWRFDGGYWARVRSQLMTAEGFGYLNTATLAPTMKPIFDSLVEYWRLMAVNPHENSNALQARQENIRRKAAAFVGASPDEIAITRNTTEGLVTVIKGLELKSGDQILYGFHEHSSNIQPWKLQAKRYGFELKEVPFPTPAKSPDEILNQFNDAITPRTRVITIAHCTTVTGGITPVKQLAKLAHDKGILVLIDGAHTLGMIQYDLHDLGVDSYASPSHKWLGAPAGSGLLYVREGLIDKIWPNIVTQSWYQDKGARKYDRLSRRPWPQVAILEDAMDYQLAIGRQRIEDRCRGLATYLRAEAAKIPGVNLYTSNDPRMGAAVTTLGINKLSGAIIHNYLRERHDIYVSPRSHGPVYPSDPNGMDGVRISTHYYNTFDQVERVLEGLRVLARKKRA